MNITAASVEFAVDSGLAAAFVAVPEGAGPFPGLIVIQEFWGLNGHIKDVASRLAREGFLAFAPDMYDGKVAADSNEARQLLMSLDQAEALAKLEGAVKSLQRNPKVAPNEIGVIGFCMGGYLALNLACNSKDVRATAAFYGRIPPNPVLANLNAPVLYFIGERDHHLPAADVDRLELFLKQSGKAGEVVRYPDADHAFMNDTRSEVYRPHDAADAWERAIAFLSKNLQG